ncbi:MAG: pentapeptide repeat-containing protein [Okeania sp. SIO3C4]|nr:pentapeptide repeat-containing protein [Okeania sp. SIO3C4]
MTGAVLRDVCLNRANLTRAKLIGAQLIRTKLLEADLTGADLSDSILCQVGFSRVKIDESVQSRKIYCPNAVLWQMRMADGTYIEGPQTAEDMRKSSKKLNNE